MKKQKVMILAVLATFLWGSAYPCIKIGYELFEIAADDLGSKFLFAGIRFVMAGLMVLAFTALKQPKDCIPKKNMAGRLVLLGILQTTIQYIFFYIGLANTTGAKSAIINSLTAFFPIVLAPLFFRDDRLTVKKGLGCLIGLAGIVIINLDGSGLGGFKLTGEGFAVFAAMAQSLASIYSKKLARYMNVMTITGYQLFIGGILLAAAGVLTGGTLTAVWQGVLLLLYMAALSAVAFTVWTYLLSHNPVSSVSIYNLLIPVFGTVLSGIFLQENIMTWTHLISIVLVCMGIVLVNRKQKAE
ncbi:DMT family transporter [Anaerostipes butyraticus]|uniref:Membrane protein n=1 Tax=Anaerostipes butyraticus TaxID=645466 RepID=A0A916Q7T1_9FIRM|nr:DMT family transporter [Anaerostipes butyraticus]GFO85993.1 membrane protein [Anaerostipes butyraticus]